MYLLLRHYFQSHFWGVGNRAWYSAWATSTSVHVALVTALALCYLDENREEPFLSIQSDLKLSNADDDLVINNSMQQELVVTPASHAGGESQLNAALRFSKQFDKMAVDSPQIRTFNNAMQVTQIPQAFFSEQLGESDHSGLGNSLGQGNGVGQGTGNGAGNGSPFFGMNAEGTTFVYVVDCSRSMNHPHPSPAKTRFKRLKIELLKSITGLKPDMQFFVIFFNTVPVPMPAQQLQPASARRKFLPWVIEVPADGQTDPREALLLALRLRPDVIYFLTDGSFDRPIQRDLKKIRQRKTSIHTFAFGNRAGEYTLKQIARNNTGRYTYIP